MAGAAEFSSCNANGTFDFCFVPRPVFCSKHASLPGLLSNPSIGDYIVLRDEPMSP